VPVGKARRGYRYVGAKFATAGLTPVGPMTVKAPRAMECRVQLKAALEKVHGSELAKIPEAAYRA
jgi:hypothetical protein